MIRIETYPADNPLTGQSKWWGEPDMPDGLEYPELTVTDDDGEQWTDPLTFVCQIRCGDMAVYDTEGLLPHEGMLYFFAALDYFLGDIDTPTYPGMGLWQKDYFRVLYSPTCDNLHTHHIVDEEGLPATRSAEALTFKAVDAVDADLKSASHESGILNPLQQVLNPLQGDDGIRLLGFPYIEEVREQTPGMLSLLQIDECDRWNLVFHDCGMLNFLIRPDHLQAGRWDKVECCLFSF